MITQWLEMDEKGMRELPLAAFWLLLAAWDLPSPPIFPSSLCLWVVLSPSGLTDDWFAVVGTHPGTVVWGPLFPFWDVFLGDLMHNTHLPRLADLPQMACPIVPICPSRPIPLLSSPPLLIVSWFPRLRPLPLLTLHRPLPVHTTPFLPSPLLFIIVVSFSSIFQPNLVFSTTFPSNTTVHKQTQSIFYQKSLFQQVRASHLLNHHHQNAQSSFILVIQSLLRRLSSLSVAFCI